MFTFVDGKLKPGFLVMDVVLANLEDAHVRPFICKTETIRKVSRLMRCMQFIVADGFSDNALEGLKNAGIVVGRYLAARSRLRYAASSIC